MLFLYVLSGQNSDNDLFINMLKAWRASLLLPNFLFTRQCNFYDFHYHFILN